MRRGLIRANVARCSGNSDADTEDELDLEQWPVSELYTVQMHINGEDTHGTVSCEIL